MQLFSRDILIILEGVIYILLASGNLDRLAARKGERNIDDVWRNICGILNKDPKVRFKNLSVEKAKYRYFKLIEAALKGEEAMLRKSGSNGPENPDLAECLEQGKKQYNEGKK